MTTVAQQKEMFYNSSRIHVLLMLNAQIYKLDQTKAYSEFYIEELRGAELDRMQEKLSTILVTLQRTTEHQP